ncbi:hypothetical protein PIB30_092064 [Stylosanthes scabra]|uniref:Uncharacterized protein n=1 Tax=Stylosanthes scabra TaxID=79078 RepID=A0ABU6YVG2_9FABA|nr:hypothetical protein [Stylosanthes scabra]
MSAEPQACRKRVRSPEQVTQLPDESSLDELSAAVRALTDELRERRLRRDGPEYPNLELIADSMAHVEQNTVAFLTRSASYDRAQGGLRKKPKIDHTGERECSVNPPRATLPRKRQVSGSFQGLDDPNLTITPIQVVDDDDSADADGDVRLVTTAKVAEDNREEMRCTSKASEDLRSNGPQLLESEKSFPLGTLISGNGRHFSQLGMGISGTWVQPSPQRHSGSTSISHATEQSTAETAGIEDCGGDKNHEESVHEEFVGNEGGEEVVKESGQSQKKGPPNPQLHAKALKLARVLQTKYVPPAGSEPNTMKLFGNVMRPMPTQNNLDVLFGTQPSQGYAPQPGLNTHLEQIVTQSKFPAI